MTRIVLPIVAAAVVVAAATAAAAAAPAAPATAGRIIAVTADPDRPGIEIWSGGSGRLAPARRLPAARLAVLSPTGAGVAYAVRAGTGLDLYVTGVYGGFEARLARVAAPRTSLALSPTGRLLAFTSPRGIELVQTFFGARPRLLPLPAAWRGSRFDAPAFSPDGRLLAVSRTWGDGRAGTLRNELAVIGVDGTRPRSLVRNPDPFGAQYRPAFAPDGRRIAFSAANGSLGAVRLADGRVEQLTPPRPAGSTRTDSQPVFAPDGSRIAFTRAVGGGRSDLYAVRADGTGAQQLTVAPAPQPGEPPRRAVALAWSPDGTTVLAFRDDHLALVDATAGDSTLLLRVPARHVAGAGVWR